MLMGVTPPWTPPDFSDQTAREGSLASRDSSSSRDRRRVGQCKRRQRARPRAAFECSGSQAVNTAQAPKAFDEAVAPVKEAYEQALAPAKKAYDEAVAPARKAYDEARSAAEKAHEEAKRR